MLRTIVLLVFVFVLAACGGAKEKPTPTVQAAQALSAPTAEATPLPPVEPPTAIPADLCLAVAPDKIANIAQGLTVTGGGTLDAATARAVRSTEYDQVFFIAAEIDGTGMEGKGDIGVWASNSLEPGDGLIFAVGGFATEFSDWGDGSKTDAQMSITSAGAGEAKDCVRAQQP